MSTAPIQLVPREWSDKPTPPRRELLWIKEGKKCHFCGRPTRLVAGDDKDQATIEHIIPRYKGGTSEDSNLASSCRDCNGRRNHEDMCGLPEGYLLGKNWKSIGRTTNTSSRRTEFRRGVLTRDDKRLLMEKWDASNPRPSTITTEALMREQRDQALKEISVLRGKVDSLVEALKMKENQLNSMTIEKMIRSKIAKWLFTS